MSLSYNGLFVKGWGNRLVGPHRVQSPQEQLSSYFAVRTNTSTGDETQLTCEILNSQTKH